MSQGEREELQREIRRLAKERKALILAHNYQPPEIQDIADLVGDSLELSLKASKTDAEVIVFCGVLFMAETAYIVSPEKVVLFPAPQACCAMASMVTPEDVRELREKHPDAPVVTYVNSYADVKAESDICCTSANVVKVISSLKEREVICLPDRNLALFAQRHFSDKKIIYFEGFCPFHDLLTPEEVMKAKEEHPDALFIAHPECRPEVIDLADHVASTSGMLRYCKSSPHKKFIIGTEVGLLYPLKKQNPDKEFYPASERMVCESMKLTTLESVYEALEKMEPRVVVEEEVRKKAERAVKRMLEILPPK